MKFFVLFLLMLVPFVAHADMVELDVGFGNGTKPFYGADYQLSKDIAYVDFALTGNSQYVQPYVSFGLQFEHINFGLAQAVTVSNLMNGNPVDAQYGIGPEVGYQQNITNLVYVKQGDSLLYSGSFNFSCTFSVGFNL